MRKRKWIIGIVCVMAAVMLIGGLVIAPIPRHYHTVNDLPLRYVIETDNEMPIQGHNQCSGFASAYVLRHLGDEVNGDLVYQQMGYKVPFKPYKGYMMPRGIIKIFSDYGHQIQVYQGELDALKAALLDEIPIIVFVGDHLKWGHFMTLIGFDNEAQELYFYDSGRKGDTNDEAPGNRTMTEDYFMQMWHHGLPVYNQVFYKVMS